MIYLVKPCTSCPSAFKQCFGESCRSLGDACSCICNICTPITRFPLGGYVIGTWVTMILVLLASVGTMLEVTQHLEIAGDAANEGCTSVHSFVFVNIAFAVVHFIAARYIQWRIVKEIEKASGPIIDKNIPHDQIASAAAEVFKYDIGFCLYFFVFVGCFAYNCWEMTEFGECEADTGPGWSAAMGMILYHVGVWNYFFCWYCMQVCCGKAKKQQSGAAGPGQTTMGQPAGE